jgi:hypothetical protein
LDIKTNNTALGANGARNGDGEEARAAAGVEDSEAWCQIKP